MKEQLNTLFKAGTTGGYRTSIHVKEFLFFLKNIMEYDELFSKIIHKKLEIMYANLRV